MPFQQGHAGPYQTHYVYLLASSAGGEGGPGPAGHCERSPTLWGLNNVFLSPGPAPTGEQAVATLQPSVLALWVKKPRATLLGAAPELGPDANWHLPISPSAQSMGTEEMLQPLPRPGAPSPLHPCKALSEAGNGGTWQASPHSPTTLLEAQTAPTAHAAR